MEERFGHSFDHVRVHADHDGATTAASLAARAVTVGADIAFDDGQFVPGTPEGELVLAHELAHVVQNDQFEGDLEALPVRSRGSSAEHEAHAAAESISAGQTAAASASPASAIATWEWWDRVSGAVEQEGLWDTITDLSGAVDRQRAQSELADRFQVVADPSKIPEGSAGNVVSQEEYQRIARTYSDIRMGRGDLTIDTGSLEPSLWDTITGNDPAATYGMNAEQYKAAAMGDIANLLQTRAGRSEVMALSNNTLVNDAGETRHGFMGLELPQLPGNLDAALGDPIHHHTTIRPLMNADGTMDTTNGYAAPTGSGSDRVNATTRGSGTNSIVSYNPGVDTMPPNADLTQDHWLPFRSDVLLMHELRHSLDQTQGTFDASIVQAADGVSDDADGRLRRGEHAAAGLGIYSADPMTENKYRAERRDIAAGGFGVRTGDASMPDRDTYYYHAKTSPAAAPVPGAPGTTVLMDPHGHDHDHDHDH
jgi:hypothetical protein